MPTNTKIPTHTAVKSSKYVNFTLEFTGHVTLNGTVMQSQGVVEYLAKTLALQLNRSTSSLTTEESRQKCVDDAMVTILNTKLFQPSGNGGTSHIATRVFVALIEGQEGSRADKDKLLTKHKSLPAKQTFLTQVCLVDLPSIQKVIEALGLEKPADLASTLTLLNPPTSN